jgi:predicted acyl esterase
MPLPCDILFEQDVAVPMSDGVKLYCDVYRPVVASTASGNRATTEVPATERVPIIMVWAPYGKHGNSELFMNELPERMGITKDMYSGYETFEGPDPAFWYVLFSRQISRVEHFHRVPKGYAVVQVDARGSWNSEGNMYFWGNNVCILSSLEKR